MTCATSGYVFSKYNFPNPNNGDRYDLSMDELVKLLDNAYNCGWAHAKELYDSSKTCVTTAASYENQDDNTKWKEVRIK